jgi:hypothetical protein
MEDKIKVLFVQKIAESEFETESIWCTKEGESYIVDNIPFIAKRIALGDTIKVEYDEDENAYYFDDFLNTSGNSTIRLYFTDATLIKPTREELKKIGCESEAFLARNIVAVNIPREVDYRPIKEYLDNGERKGKWQYEEACLSHEY